MKLSPKLLFTSLFFFTILFIGIEFFTTYQVSIQSPEYGKRTEYRLYPNKSLTPGLIRTTDINDICSHTTGTYRKTTQAMKDFVYREYGITSHPQGSYEIDHYYPLAIGGADDIKNLWPQPTPEFHQKDIVEIKLRKQLCDKEITQEEAKNIIDHWSNQAVLGSIEGITDPDDE